MHVSGSDVAVRGERLELTEVPGEVRASGGEPLTWAYLGKDHLGPVIAAIHPAREEGRAWANLRTVGALLPGRGAGPGTAAGALANPHAPPPHAPPRGA